MELYLFEKSSNYIQQQQQKAENFETEVLPHLQMLQRFALYLVRSKSEAEDLVQETLAQALKSFDSYEIGTNCRAWLCKIMVNKRSQWIRTNSRFSQLDETETQLAKAFYHPVLPEFFSKQLSRALSNMPEKARNVVWLADVEEYTYQEIADELKVPLGTVMSRLSRGRALLRRNYLLCADNAPRKSFGKNHSPH